MRERTNKEHENLKQTHTRERVWVEISIKTEKGEAGASPTKTQLQMIK